MRISDWRSDVVTSDLKNSKQIARLMHVSPHTVDERVRRVLKKLNVSNRIEAARILAVNGVFDDVTPYQPLTYQLIDLGEVPPAADAEAGRSSFRSEERRVGKGGGSTGRSRVAP